MEKREESDRLADIASGLINSEKELQYIRNSSVKIAYLISDKAKKHGKKTVFGECEKIPAKYKWKIHADFSITFYLPNIAHLTEEQYKMLMFHELLHVGIEKKDENEKYTVKPHDLEDFKLIIDKFGTSWAD